MEIKLTQGKVAIVDDEDYESLSQWSWYVSGGYAARGKTTVYMHRHIMGFPDSHVDHINGDPLDNRRCNLRLASCTENMRNRKKQVNNSSGVIGVCWHKPSQKWEARVQTDGCKKHLGRYTDIFRAMMAVDEAKIKYHGDFAYPNLPKNYYSNLSQFQRKINYERVERVNRRLVDDYR